MAWDVQFADTGQGARPAAIEQEAPMHLDVDSPEAHARTMIVHAFPPGRGAVWTPESLASSFGISRPLVIRVLAELQASGIVRRLPGPDEEYAAAGDES
jgi:hypothetical protein